MGLQLQLRGFFVPHPVAPRLGSKFFKLFEKKYQFFKAQYTIDLHSGVSFLTPQNLDKKLPDPPLHPEESKKNHWEMPVSPTMGVRATVGVWRARNLMLIFNARFSDSSGGQGGRVVFCPDFGGSKKTHRCANLPFPGAHFVLVAKTTSA